MCQFVERRVPPVAISWSLANPERVSGWLKLTYPSLPPSPYNQPRTWLSLQSISTPYHPLFNSLVFKGGCP